MGFKAPTIGGYVFRGSFSRCWGTFEHSYCPTDLHEPTILTVVYPAQPDRWTGADAGRTRNRALLCCLPSGECQLSYIEINRVGIAGLLLVLAFTAGFLYLLGSGYKFSKERLRTITAFSRLEKALYQAIESGKRIHISTGWGSVFFFPGAATFAGLTVLKGIYQRASLSDRPPVVSTGEALVDILSSESVEVIERDQEARRIPDSPASQLTGLTPFSFAGGTLPAIADQDVAANVYAGHFGSELGLLIDAADPSGAQVFASSEHFVAQAVLAATVEEPILGEELFSAGAYVQGDPGVLASLRIQDTTRWGLVFVILVGIVLRYLGII
jgi:hypothetical protein